MKICDKELERLGSISLSQYGAAVSSKNDRDDRMAANLVSLPPGICSLEGSLYKTPDAQGASGWKRRWFRLHGNLLYYFRDRHDANALGVIFLEDAAVIYNGEDERRDVEEERKNVLFAKKLSVINAVSGGKEGAFPFTVGHRVSRLYRLSACTAEERRVWVNALRASSCQSLLTRCRTLSRALEDAEASSAVTSGRLSFTEKGEPIKENGTLGRSTPFRRASGAEDTSPGFSLVVDEEGNALHEVETDHISVKYFGEVRELERKAEQLKRRINDLEAEEQNITERIEKKKLAGMIATDKGSLTSGNGDDESCHTEASMAFPVSISSKARSSVGVFSICRPVVEVLNACNLVRSDRISEEGGVANDTGRVSAADEEALFGIWWNLSIYFGFKAFLGDVIQRLPTSLPHYLQTAARTTTEGSSLALARMASQLPSVLASMYSVQDLLSKDDTRDEGCRALQLLEDQMRESGFPEQFTKLDMGSLGIALGKISDDLRLLFAPFFKKSQIFGLISDLRDVAMRFFEPQRSGRRQLSPKRPFTWPATRMGASITMIEDNFGKEKEWSHEDADIAENFSIFAGTFNLGAKDPLKRFSRSMTDSMLTKFIPRRRDLYVIGVQECISDSFFEAIDEYLGCGYKRLVLDSDQVNVYGRGDGSFVSSKYTGIMIWIQSGKSQQVSVKTSGSVSFGVAEGSKGGNFIVLNLRGTLLALINCHLAAHMMDKRKRQVDQLANSVSKALCGVDSSLPLWQCCEHVIWIGDMNFRVEADDPEKILDALIKGDLRKLKSTSDSLTAEMRSGNLFQGFEEPSMDRWMFPSYKRSENWPMLQDSASHEKRARWVRETFVIQFQEPMYKGGRTKTRIPSWCDRALFCSQRRRRLLLQVDNSEYNQEDETTTSYRGVNDAFNLSDHCPVRCEFRLFVPMSPMQGLARQQTINPHIIHVFDIFVDLGDRASCSRPLKVTLAFPSPSQCAESGGAARQTPTMRRRLTVNLQKEDERRSLSGAVYSGRQDVFDCKPSRPTIFPHVETLQGPETTRGCYLRCDLPVFWDDLHLLVRMDALERGSLFSTISTAYIGRDVRVVSAPLMDAAGAIVEGSDTSPAPRLVFSARQVPFRPSKFLA